MNGDLNASLNNTIKHCNIQIKSLNNIVEKHNYNINNARDRRNKIKHTIQISIRALITQRTNSS